MGKRTYLGGHTVLNPRSDPYHLDNTAPFLIEGRGDRPRLHFGTRLDDDLFNSLNGMGFDFIHGLFVVLQHAHLYGDTTGIARLANLNDDSGLGNYVLRIANLVVSGRRWARRQGKIEIVKSGKLSINQEKLVDVYRAMIASREEWDDLPKVCTDILQLAAQDSF